MLLKNKTEMRFSASEIMKDILRAWGNERREYKNKQFKCTLAFVKMTSA